MIDGLLAGERFAERLARLVDHDHGARRGTGDERPAHLADRQEADIDRMKAVDVLPRIDGFENARGVHAVGQRQLHKDAADRLVGVEGCDQREQLGFASVRRQRVLHRMKAAGLRGLALGADIDLARRIGADQHDRQARRHPARDQRPRLRRDLFDHAVRDRLAVEHISFSHCSSQGDRRPVGRGR